MEKWTKQKFNMNNDSGTAILQKYKVCRTEETSPDASPYKS